MFTTIISIRSIEWIFLQENDRLKIFHSKSSRMSLMDIPSDDDQLHFLIDDIGCARGEYFHGYIHRNSPEITGSSFH